MRRVRLRICCLVSVLGVDSYDAFEALAAQLDLSAHRAISCIGSDARSFERALLARHSHLRPVSADLDILHAADVIALIEVLRGGTCAQKIDLLRRVYRALPPHGCLIVVEALIDDARRRNLFALLASLEAGLGSRGSFGFSALELSQWCRDSGFQRSEVLILNEIASAVVVCK